MNIDWKRVLIDSTIVFLSSVVTGFISGLLVAALHLSDQGALIILILNPLAIMAAFAYASARIPEYPWKHLFLVAVVVWLISVIQPLVGAFSYMDWLISIVIIIVLMGIGGAIGRWFVRA